MPGGGHILLNKASVSDPMSYDSLKTVGIENNQKKGDRGAKRNFPAVTGKYPISPTHLHVFQKRHGRRRGVAGHGANILKAHRTESSVWVCSRGMRRLHLFLQRQLKEPFALKTRVSWYRHCDWIQFPGHHLYHFECLINVSVRNLMVD